MECIVKQILDLEETECINSTMQKTTREFIFQCLLLSLFLKKFFSWIGRLLVFF